MPFYDKESGIFKDSVQKAGGLVDIAALRSDISEYNKRINLLYQEMGEIYFGLHEKDPEEKLAQHVAAISKMKTQIQKWDDEIQTLRGRVKCPHCQTYVAKNIIFCPECGTRLLPETAVICPRCNTVADKKMMFCPSCGLRLPDKQE